MEETTLSTPTEKPALTRRTALAGLGAGGLGLTLATRGTAAQDAPVDLSGHPMAGMWLVTVPGVPAPSETANMSADGTVVQFGQVVGVGPDGALQFTSPGSGVWEPDGDRGLHFTVVRSLTDATGVFVGTTTVDGYPVASEDGLTFSDDGSRVRVTIRDAAGAVTAVLGEDGSLPPVSGVRMAPGNPGFPDGAAPAATPTA